jgi:hypothetical protein
METLRVLITVKTAPIPSAKYDELVCTAGVTSEGDFVRLYPVNFRDLPYSQQYHKYQWIEVEAERHVGRDTRKESYRPNCDTLRIVGEPIPTKNGDWSGRGKYALQRASSSLEELKAHQAQDKTSLGIFRPQSIEDLVISPADADWKDGFKAALSQARLWETREKTKEPPRKLPYKLQYRFRCDDAKCNGHQMMIEDWEVTELYWNCIRRGAGPDEAITKVKDKFLGQLCAADRDTHFYVGTILAHPKSWVVIGVYWPKKAAPVANLSLF